MPLNNALRAAATLLLASMTFAPAFATPASAARSDSHKAECKLSTPDNSGDVCGDARSALQDRPVFESLVGDQSSSEITPFELNPPEPNRLHR